MGLLVDPRTTTTTTTQKHSQQQESLLSLGTLSSSSKMTILSTSSQQHQQQQYSIMKNDNGGGEGRTIYFGKDISNDIVLSEEQIGKLEQLRDETTKAAAAGNTKDRDNINGGGSG